MGIRDIPRLHSATICSKGSRLYERLERLCRPRLLYGGIERRMHMAQTLAEHGLQRKVATNPHSQPVAVDCKEAISASRGRRASLESRFRFRIRGPRSDLFAIILRDAWRALPSVLLSRSSAGQVQSCVSNAQIVRAILLAAGTLATFVRCRSASFINHGGGAFALWSAERAAWISKVRRYL